MRTLLLCLFLFPLLLVAQTLTDSIISKETIVKDIAGQVLSLYRQRCSVSCSCSFAACASDILPISVCDSNRGNVDVCGTFSTECSSKRLISLVNSTFRVASWNGQDTTLTSSQKTTLCWTAGLDNIFAKYKDDSTITWQYFGSPDGVHRGYPGNSRKDCGTYDARRRPWYVGAASGPKNVIIVLDTSQSMANGALGSGPTPRIELAKTAVKTVLDTLTFTDRFAVITFDNNARVLGGATAMNFASNVVVLQVEALLASVTATLGSQRNIKGAFDLAFQVLASTNFRGGQNCKTVMLFITDITSGEQNTTEVVSYISALNTPNVPIFSYSFITSDPADDVLPKTIACANSGVWTKFIATDLANQMSQYYSYFSAQRSGNAEVVWVEPYLDTSGAGNLTAASIAVYDNTTNPPTFVGVVSLSFQLQIFQALTTNFQGLLDILVSRGQKCVDTNYTDCDLEAIRTSLPTDQDTVTFLQTVLGAQVLQRNCSNILQNQNICPQQASDLSCTRAHSTCSRSAVYDYKSQSCCSTCLGTSPSNNQDGGSLGAIVGGAIAGVIVLIAVIIILVVFVPKCSEKSSTPKTTIAMTTPASGKPKHNENDGHDSWD